MSNDHGGDYGYDQAHEVAGLRSSASTTCQPLSVGSGLARILDADGDFGYDQAHEE